MFALPGILLKLNRDAEARILCSICSLFSKLSLSLEMRAEKAESWNSASDSELRALLNHATVVRHTLTSSELSEPKHLEIASKNDFCPLPSRTADKFLNHSSLACSSASWISTYPNFSEHFHFLNSTSFSLNKTLVKQKKSTALESFLHVNTFILNVNINF